MENNIVVLKVVLNHYEDKEFNNRLYHVYTLTDYSSGNNFELWSVNQIDYLDSLQLLIQPITVKFTLLVKKQGGFKLIPIEPLKK